MLHIIPRSDQLTPWDAEMWKVTPPGAGSLRVYSALAYHHSSSSGHMSPVTQEPMMASDHS